MPTSTPTLQVIIMQARVFSHTKPYDTWITNKKNNPSRIYEEYMNPTSASSVLN